MTNEWMKWRGEPYIDLTKLKTHCVLMITGLIFTERKKMEKMTYIGESPLFWSIFYPLANHFAQCNISVRGFLFLDLRASTSSLLSLLPDSHPILVVKLGNDI